eukprot:CAMPEP_0172325260 /NCGR_PEP_ID=MMETSP1058-20130122/53536_1 /TAXON_ID=83371 /ORGANISM="Detonula confervacea, Strain CCMP 353" /LENGTH=364 /DNA_ID=CAMNT_0013041757 /DNA_START=180 /DNA_END=1271 /DNA_ORIENTATION=-
MRNHFLIAQFLFFSSLPSASSHSRWSCPEPRSSSTGIKQGPCGGDNNNFDIGADESIVALKPGPLRVTFEESVQHTSAPFRISLSDDGNDDNSCVLLDHIPHNDCCSPSLFDPTTYTPYAITISIPNVNCERCSLHLSNPMTDKIGSNGSPTGIGCTDPGTCFSVYHSCTKPFRIVGNVDDGAVQRSEYICPSLENSNEDWPTVWMGDNGEIVNANTPGVYRRESSIWSTDDYTLTTAPVQYREDAGVVCGDGAEIVNSKDPTASPTIAYSVTQGTAGLSVSTGQPSISPSLENTSPSSSTARLATSEPSVSAGQTNDISSIKTTSSPSASKMSNKAMSSQPSSSAQFGLKPFNGNYLCVLFVV